MGNTHRLKHTPAGSEQGEEDIKHLGYALSVLPFEGAHPRCFLIASLVPQMVLKGSG